MAGDFGQRIRELLDDVGDGDLDGRVEVDQRYAAAQHNNPAFNHPRGGQAFYLSEPLMQRHRQYLGNIADAVLEPGPLADAMADQMEDLSDAVEQLAPVEFNDLRRSGHPVVVDDGQTVHDRPPSVPRLTDAQLREKARRRGQIT